MTAAIAGRGVALPSTVVGQRALWEGFFRHHFADSRVARRIFAASGVRRRHIVFDPLAENLSLWSTERRMRRYVQEAEPLGRQAVAAALADAELDAKDIGQFTVASCTGYSTPGLDIRVAESLGLPTDLRRLAVGHMGCYAALPALGSAADFVAARERPALVLCVELTSLHVQPATDDPQQIVAHALFGDAAAAVVLVPQESERDTAASRTPSLRLLDVTALTDPATSDHMTWEITDHGFRMGLSPKVPSVLAEHVEPVVKELLGRYSLGVGDVGAWAVHPGGPAILSTVRDALGLPERALAASRSVLAERGNCSSPTVLLVLDELARGGELAEGGPVVALAFGPGLTLYAALLA